MATAPDAGASCSTASAPGQDGGSSSGDSNEQMLQQLTSRVALAEEYKEAGNGRYRGGDVRGAVGRYHRALLYLRGLDAKMVRDSLQQQMGLLGPGALGGGGGAEPSSLPDHLQERASSIEQGCLNNLAACLLLQENPNYEKVIAYCDRVLEVRPDNPKALYRKGCSCYHLGRYEDAYTSLKKAQQISKSDPNIRKFLLLAKERVGQVNESERALYKGMFQNVSAQSNGERDPAGAESGGF